MDIKQQTDEKGGYFFYEENNRQLAKMTYVWAGSEKMIIDHTEVDPSLKGKGVGAAMVARAVEEARNKGFKIMPLCPFAKATFDKKQEYADVLW